MSLLLFAHDAESVIIVTDTLATTTEGEAFMFQNKAWALPHMNMVIAVTGVANLGAAWNDLLRSSAIARDIDDIDTFAQRELSRLWADILAENGHDEQVTVTIYHFGFVPDSETPVRYTYRSKSGFQSERSQGPGFGAKPAPEGFELNAPDTVEEFIGLALAIRAEQDAKPSSERLMIGGELYLTYLRNWATQTMRIHRFEDYETAWQEMLTRMEHEKRVSAALTNESEPL